MLLLMMYIMFNVILCVIFGVGGSELDELCCFILLWVMLGLCLVVLLKFKCDYGCFSLWGWLVEWWCQYDIVIDKFIEVEWVDLNFVDWIDVLVLMLCSIYDDGFIMLCKDIGDELFMLLVVGYEIMVVILGWVFEWFSWYFDVFVVLVEEVDNGGYELC